MSVKLSKNRKKSFDKKPVKEIVKTQKKALDEVVQIKRSEWEEYNSHIIKSYACSQQQFEHSHCPMRLPQDPSQQKP